MAFIQEIPIRNYNQKILGYIQIQPNGDKVAMDYYHKILGYYYKQRDVTTDYYQRILYQGDMVASLIHE